LEKFEVQMRRGRNYLV